MLNRSEFIKRCFDIVVSILLLPLASVLCAAFSLLSVLLHGENPLFSQRRVGQFGRVFTIFKLRTMRSSTLDLPTHEVRSSEISLLGRIMRAAKVDELPQIYNVLKGEMSFVGPRPCLPTQTTLINERLRRGVYDAKPGITGFAQVRGLDMSSPEELAKSDQQYLNDFSMKLDLWLVIQTVFGRGVGDKTS